ncbi:unnamed protein product [Owenia fusiformis]|uniref:Uncharacterized protein n=1 Tax=Owenia fusiformis TaxID=6347 RepID=A0A8J1XW56_OWEFU|nr:unnamed protein product [Owenia fusiformis]
MPPKTRLSTKDPSSRRKTRAKTTESLKDERSGENADIVLLSTSPLLAKRENISDVRAERHCLQERKLKKEKEEIDSIPKNVVPETFSPKSVGSMKSMPETEQSKQETPRRSRMKSMLKEEMMTSYRSDHDTEIRWDCNSPEALRHIQFLSQSKLSEQSEEISNIAKALAGETGDSTDEETDILGLFLAKRALTPNSSKSHHTKAPYRRITRGQKKAKPGEMMSSDLLRQLQDMIQQTSESEGEAMDQANLERLSQRIRRTSENMDSLVGKGGAGISPSSQRKTKSYSYSDAVLHTSIEEQADTSLADDDWGDDDLFNDDSFLIRATQELFDTTTQKFKTPRPLKRRTASTPEASKPRVKSTRYTFTLDNSPAPVLNLTNHKQNSEKDETNINQSALNTTNFTPLSGTKTSNAAIPSSKNCTITRPSSTIVQSKPLTKVSTATKAPSRDLVHKSRGNHSNQVSCTTTSAVTAKSNSMAATSWSKLQAFKNSPNNGPSVSTTIKQGARAQPSHTLTSVPNKASPRFPTNPPRSTPQSACRTSLRLNQANKANLTLKSDKIQHPNTANTMNKEPQKTTLKPTLHVVQDGKNESKDSLWNDSLTDDLLCQLAEPDDMLDSQMTSVSSQAYSEPCTQDLSYKFPAQPKPTLTNPAPGLPQQTLNKPTSIKPGAQIKPNQQKKSPVMSQGLAKAVPSQSLAKPGRFNFKSSNIMTSNATTKPKTIQPVNLNIKLHGHADPKTTCKQTIQTSKATMQCTKEQSLTANHVSKVNPSRGTTSAHGKQDDDGMFDSGDELMDEDQMLAMLDQVESQIVSSQSNSQPKQSQKYSPEEIERKKQEAIKKRQQKHHQLQAPPIQNILRPSQTIKNHTNMKQIQSTTPNPYIARSKPLTNKTRSDVAPPYHMNKMKSNGPIQLGSYGIGKEQSRTIETKDMSLLSKGRRS